MGTRGPTPKPAIVHLVNGNPSKKRFTTLADGARVPIEIPTPPAHLLPEALNEWNRISIELEKLGLIATVDRAALAVYCQAYARWVDAELQLQKIDQHNPSRNMLVESTPSGYKQISVMLQISNRAVEQMHKFMAEFGMTPSARQRVAMCPQQDMFSDDKTPQQGAKDYFTKK